ncbi:YkgJ family cysteine cluster protein [Roseburia hominis]
MKRQVDLKEISDGRLYGSNDLVKADCGDCAGCFACCCNMGQSIILDPLDVFRLTKGLNMSFEELLAGKVELHVVDGLILPNLKMQTENARGVAEGPEEAGGKCGFLSESGRCTIHAIRPGICRLFPLGRYYENGGFQYFLQVHECRKENRAKVKVKKWIDTPELKRYEKFVNDWHYFLMDMEERVKENPWEMKAVSMEILKRFYLIPYEEGDFYSQFEARLREAEPMQNSTEE